VETDDEGSGGHDEEEEELGLAARPPRSGRVPLPPPPPPPPPRRPATPLASRALEEELDQDMDEEGFGSMGGGTAGGGEESAGNLEDTGAVGLFAHSRRPDEEGEPAPSRRVATGNRPGVPIPGGTTSPNFGERAGTPAAEAGAAVPGFEALLADPAVTQILLTGPDAALVDKGSGLALHADSLGDPNAVADALWRYANTAYPPPPPENPVVDVRLPDGTRVSAIFPPAAPAGAVASIRRPGLPERTLIDLVPGGNRDVQGLLDGLVASRRNVILTGDAGALPAALGAFAAAIPVDRRVVAIGAGGRSRMGWTDLSPTQDMSGLVRVAAALGPDHLVLGDVAGLEMAEIVLVATRGGEGVILALPGRAPAETLTRIGALAAPGLGGPATAATLVASAFDLVIHLVSAGEGQGRIVEIAEPRASGGELAADVALSLYNEGSKRDLATGRLAGRGVSARLAAAMSTAGSTVPSALVSK
jgi:pilus assembly protein CpaF